MNAVSLMLVLACLCAAAPALAAEEEPDVPTEKELEKLVQEYEDAGDQAGQRSALLQLLVLYPSQERAMQLAQLVADRTRDGGACQALAELAAAFLVQQDASALRTLVFSDGWNRAFQDGLRAVQVRSVFDTDGGRLQVLADYASAQVTYLTGDGTLYYFQADPDGSTVAQAVYADGAYNGEVRTERFDAEGTSVISYAGTLQNDVCTGQLTVTYGDMEYTGALGEDGSTAEAQEAAVTAQGGVVYARSGGSYLYQENVTAEDFRADCAFMGLPVYTPWE